MNLSVTYITKARDQKDTDLGIYLHMKLVGECCEAPCLCESVYTKQCVGYSTPQAPQALSHQKMGLRPTALRKLWLVRRSSYTQLLLFDHHTSKIKNYAPGAKLPA